MTAVHVLFDILKFQIKAVIERNDTELNEIENNTVVNMTDSVSDDESTHSNEDETGNNPNINSNQAFNINTSNLTVTTSDLTDTYYDEFNENPSIPAVYNFEVDFALIPLLSKSNNNNKKNNNNNNNNNSDNDGDNDSSSNDDGNNRPDHNHDNNNHDNYESFEDMGSEIFVIENDMSENWESWNANDIEEGTIIAKLGIKTGFTIGKLVASNVVTVNNEDVQYRSCIKVESDAKNCRFCLPGDSGSLYLARDPTYDYECNNINSSHYGKTYWRPIGIHRTSDKIESSTKFSYACSFTECLIERKKKFQILQV